MSNLDFLPFEVARHIVSLLDEAEKNLHMVKNFLDPNADMIEIIEAMDKIAEFRSKISNYHGI